MNTTIVSQVAVESPSVDTMIDLPMFPIIGLLVLGAIVAVVMLLAHPKTRMVGAVLGAIGLTMTVVSGIIAFRVIHEHQSWREVAVHQAQQRAHTVASQARNGSHTRVAAAEDMTAYGTVTADEPDGADDAESDTVATEADTEPSEEVPAEAESAPAEAEAPEPEANPPPADTPVRTENGPSTPRPDWVDAGGKQTIAGYQMSVAVGPFLNRAYCDEALPASLQEATARYIRDYLGPKAAGRVRLSQHYIRSHILQAEWEEPAENPLGPRIKLDNDENAMWTKLHVLLQFDRDVDAHIEQQWKAAVVHQRLAYSGIALATILGLLGVLFATLKIDQSTGGKYRGRLSAASIVAVLALLAAVGGAMVFLHDVPRPTSPQMTAAAPIGHVAVESTHREVRAVNPGAVAVEAARVSGANASWGAVLTSVLLLAIFVALLLNAKTRRIAWGLAAFVIAIGFALFIWVSPSFSMNNHAAGSVEFPTVSPLAVLVVVVSAVYLVLITVLSRHRWAWALGLIACLVAAMLLTSANPPNMLMVAVPSCIVYTVAAFAFRAGREDPAPEKTPGVTAADIEVS